jgi:DUF3017 family protein
LVSSRSLALPSIRLAPIRLIVMTPAEAATAPDLAVVDDAPDVETGIDDAVAVGDGSGVGVQAEAVEAAESAEAVEAVESVEPSIRRTGVLHELPLALVISGVAVGLVVIALHHFRWGNLVIAGSLLAGALLRLVLPTRRAGLLAVRARFTDVVTMLVMGVGLLVLALITST